MKSLEAIGVIWITDTKSMESPLRGKRRRLRNSNGPGGSLSIEKIKFCEGRLQVLKLTYPKDVGGIVLDGRMTSKMGTCSLRRSVGVLAPADFRPICDWGI